MTFGFETQEMRTLKNEVRDLKETVRTLKSNVVALNTREGINGSSIDVNSSHIGDLCDSMIHIREQISAQDVRIDTTVRHKLYEYKGRVHKRLNEIVGKIKEYEFVDATLAAAADRNFKLLEEGQNYLENHLDVLQEEMFEVLDIITNDDYHLPQVPGQGTVDDDGIEILPPLTQYADEELTISVPPKNVEEYLSQPTREDKLALDERNEIVAEWTEVFSNELAKTAEFTDAERKAFISTAANQLLDYINE